MLINLYSHKSGAHRLRDSMSLRSAATMGVGLVFFSITQPALSAPPPTYSVISPSEFNLPVAKPGKGINFFFQNAVYTNDNKSYNNNGDKVNNPTGNDTELGVTRFGRLFSFKSTPDIGYYWEVLLPEVHINAAGKGGSVSGLADPLGILAIYTRPTKNFLIGMENGFTAPIGNNDLTYNYYTYQPNIIFDYHSSTGFGVDGLVGFAFKTHNDNTDTNPGTDFYADLRLRYKLNHWISPALSYDYQQTHGVSGAHNAAYQDIVGGGAKLFFNKSHTLSGSIAYRVGVAGKNTVRVNGPYARFVALF